MALRIILPDYLGRNAEALLFAALLNFGAERITAKEGHFTQMPLSWQDFLSELKLFLPQSDHWLVDRFKVTILDSSEHGNPIGSA
jgi:hypothetical protein